MTLSQWKTDYTDLEDIGPSSSELRELEREGAKAIKLADEIIEDNKEILQNLQKCVEYLG